MTSTLTNAVACLATGRDFIGFERDLRYVEMSKARLLRCSGKQRTLGKLMG
jgi:DNA modification methylase